MRNRDLASSGSCTGIYTESWAEEQNTANNGDDWAEIGWVEEWNGSSKAWYLIWEGGENGTIDPNCAVLSSSISHSTWDRFRARNTSGTTWALDWDSGSGFTNKDSCDEGFSPGMSQGFTPVTGVAYGTGARDHQTDLRYKYDSSHWTNWGHNRSNPNMGGGITGYSYYRCSGSEYYIWNASNPRGGTED